MNDVARLLDLRDRLPVEWSGLLTRSAQALAAVQSDQPDERRCPGCGVGLPPQARGRPRRWCQAPECQKLRKNGSKCAGPRFFPGLLSPATLLLVGTPGAETPETALYGEVQNRTSRPAPGRVASDLQVGSLPRRKADGMFARVSTYQETEDSLAESVRRTPAAVEKARAMSGFKGVYSLVDRSSGKSMTITLWETEEAMRESEEAANQLRDDEAAATGANIVSVERYEVATSELY